MSRAAIQTAPLPLRVSMVMIDLDGTLINTAPDLAESANRMLRDLGMAPHSPAQVENWIGNGVSRLVKRALTGELDAEPDAALFERGYARFQHHYAELVAHKSRPYPGVIEGLDTLKAAGFHLACITNKAEAFTLPLLRKPASIILTGSTVAEQGTAGLSVYAATKAAVRSLARSLSAELNPQGVRVNVVSPGPIETPIFGKMGMPDAAVQAWAGEITGKVPMGRFGQPSEVAKAVLFLASDDSSYMLGENILVDGGMASV